MSNDTIVVNGIDAASGRYLVDPIEVADMASIIRKFPPDVDAANRVSASLESTNDPHLGLPDAVRPEIVAEAGWGVLFHKDELPDVRNAVMPLFEHRRAQIKNDRIIKVLEDFRPGDDIATWLARHRVGQGSIEPEKVPFYVLIVGGPDQIPFEFGFQLDVEYCVGRLHFDTADEYSRYVASVIEYETAVTVPTGREAVFWSPRHALDRATQLSTDQLTQPLICGVPSQGFDPPEPTVLSASGFRGRKFFAGNATKQALLDVLQSNDSGARPAFLFTASHGVGFTKDDVHQRNEQGALLCQDWPPFKPVQSPHYLAASDISENAKVHGLISFHFACFGAGTPARSQFVHVPGKLPPEIAPMPFFARLPQRLLAHPGGGALACIGHVERAWGYSIVTAGAGAQRLPFRNCIERILAGKPVGIAMKDFNERYASLTVTLTGLLQRLGFGAKIPDSVLVSRWIERNDAEGYIVLGDPAASLRTGSMK